jgi:hypothetical protein
MKEFRFNNIITELEKYFPKFTNDLKLKNLSDDEPGIFLTFLIPFVSERWNDMSIQEHLAMLMNDMSNSKDAAVKNTFSDFALDFYLHFEEHKINIQPFMINKLLPETRIFIQDCSDYWYKANKTT